MTTRIFSLSTASHDAPSGQTLTLALKELMPDEGGDIVVLNQMGTDVTVLTDEGVIATGIGETYTTRTGHDVTGFAFCRFTSGVTVFYPRTHHLMVTNEEETESV